MEIIPENEKIRAIFGKFDQNTREFEGKNYGNLKTIWITSILNSISYRYLRNFSAFPRRFPQINNFAKNIFDSVPLVPLAFLMPISWRLQIVILISHDVLKFEWYRDYRRNVPNEYTITYFRDMAS